MKMENEFNFGMARSVQSFTDSRHNRLIRCKACGFKYDYSKIQLFGGHYVCKYCIMDLEKHIGGNDVSNNTAS